MVSLICACIPGVSGYFLFLFYLFIVNWKTHLIRASWVTIELSTACVEPDQVVQVLPVLIQGKFSWPRTHVIFRYGDWTRDPPIQSRLFQRLSHIRCMPPIRISCIEIFYWYLHLHIHLFFCKGQLKCSCNRVDLRWSYIHTYVSNVPCGKPLRQGHDVILKCQWFFNHFM